jgi:hypothetical protein
MSEYLKLILFLLGLICLCMVVAVSWVNIIPTAVFWLTLHFRWPLANVLMGSCFDTCDPAAGAV